MLDARSQKKIECESTKLNDTEYTKGGNVRYRFREIHRLGVILQTVDNYALSHRLDRLIDMTTTINDISWFQNLTSSLLSAIS